MPLPGNKVVIIQWDNIPSNQLVIGLPNRSAPAGYEELTE